MRYGALHAQAAQAMAAVGLDDIDPATPAGRLGVGEQQIVEIARAWSRPCRVLILDEPTAALSAPQVERLFQHVARLRAAGVAIVYISHRLDELRRIADRISVLRDGRLVATRPARRLGLDEVVRLMVGTNPERELRAAAPGRAGPWCSRVERLCRGDRVRDVSFELHRGEVLGWRAWSARAAPSCCARSSAPTAPRRDRCLLGAPSAASCGSGTRARPCARGSAWCPRIARPRGCCSPLPVRINLTLASLVAVRRRFGLDRPRAPRRRRGRRRAARSSCVPTRSSSRSGS